MVATSSLAKLLRERPARVLAHRMGSLGYLANLLKSGAAPPTSRTIGLHPRWPCCV